MYLNLPLRYTVTSEYNQTGAKPCLTEKQPTFCWSEQWNKWKGQRD